MHVAIWVLICTVCIVNDLHKQRDRETHVKLSAIQGAEDLETHGLSAPIPVVTWSFLLWLLVFEWLIMAFNGSYQVIITNNNARATTAMPKTIHAAAITSATGRGHRTTIQVNVMRKQHHVYKINVWILYLHLAKVTSMHTNKQTNKQTRKQGNVHSDLHIHIHIHAHYSC